MSVDVGRTRRFQYAAPGLKKKVAFVVNDIPAADKSDRVYLRELGLDGVDHAAVLFPP